MKDEMRSEYDRNLRRKNEGSISAEVLLSLKVYVAVIKFAEDTNAQQ